MRINLRLIKRNILYMALILILVMFTDSLWIRNISANRFYIIIGLGVAALFLGLQHCKKKYLQKLSLLLVPIAISMIVNWDFNTLILFKMAIICICWLIATKTDLRKLTNSYISLMLFIAVFSLICMLFRHQIVEMSFIPTIDSGSYGTKALFFTNVKIGTGNLYFLRNQGPFWEPGAYQAYLNVAIMLLLFTNVERRHRNVELLILCGTVVSTISTTGYMVLGVLILAKMFMKDNASWKSKLGIAVILLVVVLVALNNDTINYLLFDKMSKGSSNNISNATRLYSIIQNCNGILQNPIFGIGPRKYSALFTQSTSFLGAVSVGVNTTTSLSVWALYGIVYFIAFNAGLIYFTGILGKRSMAKVFLLIAVFMIYNSENLNYSLFFNLLPILGVYVRGGILNENSDCINCTQQKK